MPDPPPPFDAALYAQLRAAAAGLLRGERVGHTLSATALVHEAYLSLRKGDYSSPAAYRDAAAKAMRHLLIDHARARHADKRGGGGGDARRVTWDGVGDALSLAAADRCAEILDLDAALSRLEQQDPQAAALVRLRFYAGLDLAEAAADLGVSLSTAKRDWKYARATLYRLLSDE